MRTEGSGEGEKERFQRPSRVTVFVSESSRIHEGWWDQWVECRVWLSRLFCYSNVDSTLAGTLAAGASSHLISSHLISSHLISFHLISSHLILGSTTSMWHSSFFRELQILQMTVLPSSSPGT